MKSNHQSMILRTGILILALITTVMALVSCSPVQGQPSVKISGGPDVFAGDVTISADIAGYDIAGDTGHIIYYMDISVPTYYAHSAISKAGTCAVSTETSHTWKDVSPGEHKFSVQLVKNDNSPLPVPIVDSITINVGAPEKGPELSITNPSDGASLTPGNILVMLEVKNFIISSEDMGVLNREGEGHLIYYLDEEPPVDQGIPAKTDTSIVSTELKHLWKAVKEGQHVISVQLVNNDDTPLETPVIESVSIDVAAG